MGAPPAARPTEASGARVRQLASHLARRPQLPTAVATGLGAECSASPPRAALPRPILNATTRAPPPPCPRRAQAASTALLPLRSSSSTRANAQAAPAARTAQQRAPRLARLPRHRGPRQPSPHQPRAAAGAERAVASTTTSRRAARRAGTRSPCRLGTAAFRRRGCWQCTLGSRSGDGTQIRCTGRRHQRDVRSTRGTRRPPLCRPTFASLARSLVPFLGPRPRVLQVKCSLPLRSSRLAHPRRRRGAPAGTAARTYAARHRVACVVGTLKAAQRGQAEDTAAAQVPSAGFAASARAPHPSRAPSPRTPRTRRPKMLLFRCARAGVRT